MNLSSTKISEYGSIVILSNYLNEIVKKLPKDIYIKLKPNDVITDTSGDIVIKPKKSSTYLHQISPVRTH